MTARRSKKVPTPKPRRAGRPSLNEDAARETFQLRVSSAQRARWQVAADGAALSDSAWAREGLDAWVAVCERAAALGLEPRALVAEALEDHARVRAAVAELATVKSPTEAERRILRVLDPSEWARREAAS